jgi:hypothetical protein
MQDDFGRFIVLPAFSFNLCEAALSPPQQQEKAGLDFW